MSLNPSPVSFGQDRRRDRPYTNYSQRSTSNGVTSTAMQHVPIPVEEPPVTPAVSPEVMQRRQTMGLEPRTPSPQFRNSPVGVQRFGAAPPASTPANFAGGSETPHYRPGSAEWGRINRAYHDAQKQLTEMVPEDPGYKEHSDYVASLRSQLGMGGQQTGSGMAVPFHPMSGATPATAGAAPTTSSPATPPPQPPSPNYVRRGPNLAPEAPLDDSERKRRVQQMYQTAADSLAGVGDTGANGTPNYGPGGAAPVAPRTEFTYSDTAAHKAVEMGTGQARSNEAAMRRGEQRRVGAINDASAAQYGQNLQAAKNVGQRLDQIDRGAFPLPPGSEYSPPSGGAVAGGQQPQQQHGLSNFHVNPQTGERIGWNGQSWQKVQ